MAGLLMGLIPAVLPNLISCLVLRLAHASVVTSDHLKNLIERRVASTTRPLQDQVACLFIHQVYTSSTYVLFRVDASVAQGLHVALGDVFQFF